ncbi:hypothetical protein RyT2_25330 [Pseudolactococcus yaeyamensis]
MNSNLEMLIGDWLVLQKVELSDIDQNLRIENGFYISAIRANRGSDNVKGFIQVSKLILEDYRYVQKQNHLSEKWMKHVIEYILFTGESEFSEKDEFKQFVREQEEFKKYEQ